MDATGAVALNALQTRQQFALKSLKHSLDNAEQTVEIVENVASEAGGIAQPLNSAGRGQIVNILA